MIGELLLWAIAALVAIAIVAYLLSWLYHRSTKELAFVRTGLGGERVVIDGGALVLPVVHEVVPVNLNVVRIEVARTKERAVITRDRMRVDIEAEFFVRVAQTREAVGAAASTLGRRALEPDQLAELLAAKFVGALRSAAATMTLDEMHERRGDFVALVDSLGADALARNGLELESVAITDLDQTDLEHFNPANRFDAEGLTRLIESIESRRTHRNDVEQSSMLAIRERNLAAERRQLELEREGEGARLDQERELEALRAGQRAEIARARATGESEAERARIDAQRTTREADIERTRTLEEREIESAQRLETVRIERERDVETARIEQERELEAARIEREKALQRQRIDQRHELDNAEIVANEDLERARIVSERQLHDARIAAELETERARIGRDQDVERAKLIAERDVEAARIDVGRELDEARVVQERELARLEIERERALELATIEREIAVLAKRAEEAEQRAESDGARARAVAAEERVATARETEVAERIAAIDRLIATKDADNANVAAEVERVAASVAAEALRLRHEAENVLSDGARDTRTRERMIDRLEGIVRESVRPLENIEGIRILSVDGLGGGAGGGAGQGASRSPTDEVIESALRYRAQAPLIDQMMKEIGIENAGVAKMGDVFRSAKDARSLAGAAKSDASDD